MMLAAGLTCFIIGSYLLIDTNVPGYEGVSRPIIWLSTAVIVAVAVLIGSAALRVLRKKPATGASALIGTVGTVREVLDPTGMVYLNGELWTATVSGQATLPVGSRVEVTAINGLRLDVRESTAQEAPTTKGSLENRGASVIPVQRGLEAADTR